MSRRFLTDLIGRFIGVGGATPDTNNPLSVRGLGSLFDGNTTGHQVKINKSLTAQTASILFQTGYSGRAEFGTLGNNNYTVKVSSNGSLWNDAFEVAAATGVTDFKKQPTFNGQALYHTGTFDIANYAALTGATFSGDVVAPNLVRNNANNNLGQFLLETPNGSHGGYGNSNGTGGGWGADIWAIGSAYLGSGFGASYLLGEYGLAWLRPSNAGALADAGEGLYVRRNSVTIAAIGLTGAYFAGKLKVIGDSLLANVGIGGAIPDATNRLSVNTPAVLLNNAGAGIDMKFNKNLAANDAALTFQQGFVTQALMGLLGDNDFTLKVGPSFLTALTVNRTTGAVSFPNTTITATPAGVDNEVQYRNGSALGAASMVRIGTAGNLIMVSNSAQPALPPADTLQLYARRRAGTDWPEIQRPNGREIPLAPHMGLNRVAFWSPSVSTTVVVNGMPRTAVGTVSTTALSATNLSTSIRRWRVTSAATANSVADERAAATLCWRGNNSGLGGFTYTNRISLVTLQPAAVAYFGLLASTAALSTTQTIDALVNCIGFGFTNGVNTNWQLIVNDASGAPTLTDLGASFPVNNTTNVYTIIIYAAPNGTDVSARIVNETTGAVFETDIATNIPTNTTFLSVRNYMNNGGAVAAVAYECSGVYLETDY